MDLSKSYKLVDIALLGLRNDSPALKPQGLHSPSPKFFPAKEFGTEPQVLFTLLRNRPTTSFEEDLDYVVERLLRMRRCHQVGAAVSVHWESLQSAIDRIKYTQEGKFKKVREEGRLGGRFTE
jgi:hypothetical protein